MKEMLSGWVTTLTGASLLCCCAMCLCPKGRVREILKLVCGIVLAIALISPIAEFDFGVYASGMASYRAKAESIGQQGEDAYSSLTRTVIEDSYAAYISDKAQGAGLPLSDVAVGVKWGDEGLWYPYEVWLGSASEDTRALLSPVIEAELGIPAERQYWEIQ